MNKLKSSKVMLVLSVLLVLVMIGSASAADEAGNETVSTSTGVDTVSQEVDSVDEEVSAAEPTGDLVVNDTSKQDVKLGASNDEDVLTAGSINVNTFAELKNNINNNNYNVINIMDGFTLSQSLSINRNNLVIDGNNHTFTGTTSNKFNSNGHSYITFKNMNFQGTTNRIFNFINCHHITLENCNVDNHNAAVHGFVICFESGHDLTMKDSSFTDIFESSTSTTYCCGGVLQFYTKAPYNLFVDHCYFKDIYTRWSGGALRTGMGTNAQITNCYFENCYNYRNGGAIEFYSPNSVIDSCTFIHCQARDGGGGAIDLFSIAANTNITNCIFINNSATATTSTYSPYGGAITAIGSNTLNTLIENCSFIGNFAQDKGGAIVFESPYSNIKNCEFINNTASSAGAVNFIGSNSNITNCNFTLNNATLSGGAVMFSGTKCNMTNCNLINNTAYEGGAVQFNGNKCQMINCTYINNTATVDGGGLCSEATGSVIDGCSFSKNNASLGPDFYGHGKPITFRNMFFTSLWLTNSNYTTSDSYTHTLRYGFGTSWDQPARWDENISAFLKKNTHCTIYLVYNINNITHNVLNVSNVNIVGKSPLNPNASYIDLSGWNSSGFIVNASEITFTKLRLE